MDAGNFDPDVLGFLCIFLLTKKTIFEVFFNLRLILITVVHIFIASGAKLSFASFYLFGSNIFIFIIGLQMLGIGMQRLL